jgi:hypothetical protein
MSDCKEYNNGCKLQQFQKNNYFYGKLMSVEDFKTEQEYLDGKRHLLNRLVFGPGIVCGFDISGLSLEEKQAEIEITFAKGGVALDLCGNEIVVPNDSKTIVCVSNESEEESVPLTKKDVSTFTYLYLKHKPWPDEMVKTVSNVSSCEEVVCRPNKIVETFEVIASENPPPIDTITCPEPFENPNREEALAEMKEWVDERLTQSCKSPEDPENQKVFLAAVNSELEIDPGETITYRSFVYNNKLLWQQIACHLSDFENPHQVEVPEKFAYCVKDIEITEDDEYKEVEHELGDCFPVVDVYKRILCTKEDEDVIGLEGFHWRKILDCNPSPELEIRLYEGGRIFIVNKNNKNYHLKVILRA